VALGGSRVLSRHTAPGPMGFPYPRALPLPRPPPASYARLVSLAKSSSEMVDVVAPREQGGRVVGHVVGGVSEGVARARVSMTTWSCPGQPEVRGPLTRRAQPSNRKPRVTGSSAEAERQSGGASERTDTRGLASWGRGGTKWGGGGGGGGEEGDEE